MRFPHPFGTSESGRVSARQSLWSGGSVAGLVLALVIMAAVVSIVGCSDRPEPRSTLFDRAEKHYRLGDYDAALREYQAFLERFPNSPLSPTARRRLRALRFEVETVLSADHSYLPSYTGGEESAQQIGSTVNRENTDPLPEHVGDDNPPRPTTGDQAQ